MRPHPVKMLPRPCLSTTVRPSPSHSAPWPFHPLTHQPSMSSPPHPTTTITIQLTNPSFFLWTRNLYESVGCNRPTSTMQLRWLSRRRDGWRNLFLGISRIHCDFCGTGVCRSAIGARPTTGGGARPGASALACHVASRLAW